MRAARETKPRPYWHVDAKWITGILLLVALNVTALALVLTMVTAPENGIDLLTTTLASAFSFEGGGLDSEADLATVRQQIANSPEGEWQPIPALRIVVREEDIAGMSPRQVRLWFFRLLAEPIYTQGPQGLASLMTGPGAEEVVESGVGPLGIVNAQNHARLRIALAVSGLITLLLLGLLVVFSHRAGRLSSPGCAFVLASIPGLALLAAGSGWLARPDAAPPVAVGDSLSLRLTQLAADVLPGVMEQARPVFLGLAGLGAGLILLGLLAAITFRTRGKKQPIQQVE